MFSADQRELVLLLMGSFVPGRPPYTSTPRLSSPSCFLFVVFLFLPGRHFKTINHHEMVARLNDQNNAIPTHAARSRPISRIITSTVRYHAGV